MQDINADSLKQTLKRFHVHLLVKQAEKCVGFSRAKIGLVDRYISRSYFRQNKVRKLQLGCGGHVLKDGWLNSDYYPVSPKCMHLNAAECFPFRNDEFDFIFSEHMIEHLPYASGVQMIRECFRILKNRGVIRLSTPDLSFLIRLHQGARSKTEHDYIVWATKTWINDAPYFDSVFVINNFVRDWGHTFIYDENTLRFALQKAGFTQIKRCELNRSEHDELQNLENENRLPGGLLKLETMTLEGTKLTSSSKCPQMTQSGHGSDFVDAA
jgi:predicted SAM-dependent methyltransferase